MSARTGIARIRLNAADPAALAGFFVAGLGFAPAHRVRDGATVLALGPTCLEIGRAAPDGRPYPGDVPGWSPVFQHIALAVPDMGAALARLQVVRGWTPISVGGPERLPPRSGGVVAFKFRDPDGHPLELIHFPTGDGGHRIDHTAISVADTARSLAFYADLGFAIASASLNVGPEQDRLDAVPDARVAVTGLRIPGAPAPHLELLCYRGDFARDQPRPALGDVAATRILLAAPLAGACPAVRRDPDGHVVQLGLVP